VGSAGGAGAGGGAISVFTDTTNFSMVSTRCLAAADCASSSLACWRICSAWVRKASIWLFNSATCATNASGPILASSVRTVSTLGPAGGAGSAGGASGAGASSAQASEEPSKNAETASVCNVLRYNMLISFILNNSPTLHLLELLKKPANALRTILSEAGAWERVLLEALYF
jgi:hypothetical protein